MIPVPPTTIINSSAPTRICDNGGWTDTWFAKYGNIFNIAIAPRAHVQILVYPRHTQPHPVTIHAENLDEPYARALGTAWQRHPLLEATIDMMGIPDEVAAHIHLYSDMPAGASAGTSAAVTVALIGALDALTPTRLAWHEVALRAQQVETEKLGQQCGIQDQLAAVYGGLNYIEMFQYPHATISPVSIPDALWHELEQRLTLIYLGTSHSSTAVHEQVIQHLEDAGSAAPQLTPLRQTANQSRQALIAGNFSAFGQAMIANTEAQRNLHPALISPTATHIITIAQKYGALGWKVNGAGGDGGSVTILGNGHRTQQRAMLREMMMEVNGEVTGGVKRGACRHIPIQLSRDGLRVWQTNKG